MEIDNAIDFWCGINEDRWNHHPVNPGPLVCIAPIYGATTATKKENRVKIPPHCKVRLDSGAFSDGPGNRVSFEKSKDRQLLHAHKYGYIDQIDSLASYDLLIDEKWEDGVRYKRRWSENDAWAAVVETVQAAEYLSKNYTGNKVLSAQGVTADQYLECSRRVMEYFDLDNDIFGLGGWCISGKMPKQMRPSFNSIMMTVLPYLGKSGVKKVHIWGVTDVTFLGPLLYLCDENGLHLSTDSSGPQVRPANGSWGFRGWTVKNYRRPPVEVRGIHRAIHVQLMRTRLKTLRQSEFYHHPMLPKKEKMLWGNQYQQPALWEQYF